MTDSFLSFLLACLIVEVTPGPNMGYLAVISATRGRKAGMSLVAGISTGLFVIGLAALSGAAVVIQQSPFVYQALRWAGVLYMFWLAWENWQQKDFARANTKEQESKRPICAISGGDLSRIY